VLKSFTNSWGSWAQPGLAGPVLSGATLYGTTSGSYGPPAFHTNSFGTVFQINTDGSGFSVLKSFGGGSDGATPTATLTWCGSTLYGTTCYGGISNCGVVFAIGYPPSIQTPPQTQTAELGSTVDFGLLITGSQPLVYQWFCDGTAIADCTNRVLCLSGIQASNVGTYSVVVTNLFGAVTSSPAMLNVIAPVERRPVPAINLNGDLGTTLHVEYADALGLPANWLPLDTVNLSNVAQFYFDITKPLPPQRFYRAWQTETPIVVPRLRLPYFVPAITITGSIGDTVRLDCINAIGPTDAWVTLDTITLTNTSQLYFDVSTAWNPGRLYRIVPLP
jgi:hypothetical protein